MSLTVPTTGSIAGRSANLNAVPDQTGQIVGEVAEALTQVGVRIEDDRLSREANRLSVDMTRDLNTLSLEMRSIGDPDVLDATWTERNAALRQSYLEGQTTDGRPRVDPRNRERIGLAFDQVSNSLALQVGARSLEARFSQRRATDMQMQQEIVTAAGTVDAGTREIFLGIYEDQAAEQVALGIISPEQAQSNIMAVRNGTANAAAIAAIGADPEGFLAAAEAGEFNDLGGETVARYSVQAQGILDNRDADLTREATRLAEEQAKAIEAQINDMIPLIMGGQTVIDEALLADPAFQAHPRYPAAQAALAFRAERLNLRTMTPDELKQLVIDERTRPVDPASPADTARLGLVEAELARANTGWGTDPMAYASSIPGLVPDTLTTMPPFDPADPAALAGFLEGRRDLGQSFAAQGYITAPRALSEPERLALVAQASVATDPADRAALAATLMEYLPGAGPDSAGALITDGVFKHMGSLVATGTPASVAEEVFRGQQALAAGNVILPSPAERIGAAGQTLGAIFGDLAGGEAEQARIREATDALYAARMRVTDPGNNAVNFDSTEYLKALHHVMGGSGDYNSDQALGGIRQLNGFDTALPRGVSSALAESALANLGYDASGGWEPATMQAQLVAASLTGMPPEFVADPNFWDQMQGAQIKALSEDVYVVVFDTATGTRALQNAQGGGEFRFSLRRLIQGAQP